jgi:predicted transglutaminase-like cysteine proteinase
VRSIFRVSLAITVVMSTGYSTAYGSVRTTVEHIRFDAPTLAPMAYTQFCLRYPGECRAGKIFRGGPVQLSVSRRIELARVNDVVNARIVPEANQQGLAGEIWLINPYRGDCNDYAVTKRHELMLRGWPARALLLSEVVTVSGEHHLVLVVRTLDGDLVLDSLTDRIKPWFKSPYRWVRMQLPSASKYWTRVVSSAA